MIEILFGLSIIFLIALIGYIYIQSQSATSVPYPPVPSPPVSSPPVPSPPVSSPPVSYPPVSYPPVTPPPPVTYPDPVVPRSRLATVNGRDFLCPTGYYYEGDGTQQACVKEGTSGFVCPSGWDILSQKPFCSFNVDSSGNDGAAGGDASTPPPPPPPPPTYTFTKFMDSGRNDIRWDQNKSLEQLKDACNSLSNCRGFNTNGWLKHTIKPQNEWINWTSDPTKGLYVKN
jgi:hypothetical protein